VGDFGTARSYRLAISEVLKSGVPARQPELLRAHLWAPRYSASSAELAEAVGYNSWRVANFQYGALAHRIAIELGVFRPPRGFWVNVLIRWRADHTRSPLGHTRSPLGHTRYLLRLEVVRALIDLGFAKAPPSPSVSRTPPGRSLGRYSLASGDDFSDYAPSSGGALSGLERRAMRRR
jgi:hypothetical protein